MDPKQALQLMVKACGLVQGTLADHQALQQALQVLTKALEPQPVEAPKAE